MATIRTSDWQDELKDVNAALINQWAERFRKATDLLILERLMLRTKLAFIYKIDPSFTENLRKDGFGLGVVDTESKFIKTLPGLDIPGIQKLLDVSKTGAELLKKAACDMKERSKKAFMATKPSKKSKTVREATARPEILRYEKSSPISPSTKKRENPFQNPIQSPLMDILPPPMKKKKKTSSPGGQTRTKHRAIYKSDSAGSDDEVRLPTEPPSKEELAMTTATKLSPADQKESKETPGIIRIDH